MEQSELNQILEQHKLWLDTNRMQGSQAYLKSANLEGADLRGANLKDANLRGTILHCVNLHGANLAGANLINADLRGANLGGANLTGANLGGANLGGANLGGANLKDADLRGAKLRGADLTNAILPNISWIIPGCLVQLNHINYGFYLEKEDKYENFVQGSIGFFIQDNREEKAFDMLVEDRIIRGIPDWVKYSGLKKLDP